MTCAQGLLRLLWGGARSWSATGLRTIITNQEPMTNRLVEMEFGDILKFIFVSTCQL